MSEEKVDVNKKIDELEAAKEKYLSDNTVISIGGYSFTPAKLMIAGGIISSVLGGLYGAFEVYKDYMDMKEKISKYVAPDLSEFDKRLEVIQKEMTSTKSSVQEATNYANEIKNDLKKDIRRVETVVDNVERSVKTDQREVNSTIKEIRKYSDNTIKEVNSSLTKLEKETAAELRGIRKELDDKIKKALDNPLANQ